jgi:sugar O-acyltransferase (sialic acid O-acetyltransferase NeuD family)
MIIVKIMNKIVIFGSGGHAKVIFSEVIKLKKFKFLGFVDDFKKKGELIISSNKKNYYNLGSIKEVISKKNDLKGIIGVGLNFVREKIVKDIKKINNNFKFQQIISKDAIINSNVFIDEGTLVVSGTTINTGTKIGRHCIINTSCSIDHDNKFSDFSSAGPGVVTGGNVEVGYQSYLGLGSLVRHNVKILDNTIVGFGSLVNKDCKKNSIYWGSPAKKIRKRKNNENYL